ncbi:MAG: 50S ribosomal protein L6 [Candidatus Micrarchaeota archaeon]|nr:50S ribosomal protein L6 [Candidatus Micrarchaeota archaeon]
MSTENKPIKIAIPQGVEVEVKGNDIIIKGSLGANTRRFNDSLIKVKKEGNEIVMETVKERGLVKKAQKVENAFRKELENDMKGVNQYFERNMRMVFAHFPINVEVKGDRLNINNIIGERVPRVSKIVGSTKIESKGQNVRIYGTSIDDVSQTAANIRLACRIRNKDSRVFQDGLYYEIE